tara:strand:+ start:1094 stop:1600 length:507 start_codon:yes stop_codon:yes gene_type:complete
MGTQVSKKKKNRYRCSTILKLDEIDKTKIKIYKIIGGQNLPIEQSQNNILNPYFNIEYGFIDKFIEQYVLSYDISTVVDYIDSLNYNLCDISIKNIKTNDNSLIFRYNPSKIPFRYRSRKKHKENWTNTINSVVKHKYVPMQIKTINRRRGKLDIQFLVDKQNYIVLV